MAQMTSRSLTALTQRLALLSYVKHHPGVTIARAAQHFGVSDRTIRRWVDQLWLSGYRDAKLPEALPGDMIDFHADAYAEGRLLVVDTLDADIPLSVAVEEADLVLSALEVLEPIGVVDPETVASLTAKLAYSLTGRAPLREAHLFSAQAAVLEALTDTMAVIRHAISNDVRLFLTYEDIAGRRTDRSVSPVGVIVSGEYPVLAAWCHMRDEARYFRIDRIVGVMCGDQPRSHIGDVDTADIRLTGGQEVTVVVDKQATLALESLGWPEVVAETDSTVTVQVTVADEAWLKRWVFTHACAIIDIQPVECKQRVWQSVVHAVANTGYGSRRDEQ